PLRRACLLVGLCALLCLPALAADRSRVKAVDYVIDAEIVPKTHRLSARAKIKFVAGDDTNFASFELNNGLRITKVLDANGRTLSAERITQDNAVRISFPTTMAKGSSSTLTFDYEGPLASADDSPVEGLKLAYIGEDTAYLLYPARWFPITNYGIDRFTATIYVTAPSNFVVIGSGAAGPTKAGGAGKSVTPFAWQKPSFPGSIFAGPFQESAFGPIKVYFSAGKKQFASAYAETASKELEYFSTLYGPPPAGGGLNL